MYILGVGTASPEQRYTKSDCWSAFQASPWFEKLGPRSRTLAARVLRRDNGIEARRLAVDRLPDVFAIDPDTLHARFVANAPVLASAAAARALADAGLRADEIDAVVVSTCTGYLCPGLSGYVSERARPARRRAGASIWSARAVRAALPNMRTAHALLAAGHCSSTCCRSASKSAARRCTSTTMPAC